MKHVCAESKTCSCSIVGDEPDEECPVHGAGEWPPRCGICGRFVERIVTEYYESNEYRDSLTNNVLEIV